MMESTGNRKVTWLWTGLNWTISGWLSTGPERWWSTSRRKGPSTVEEVEDQQQTGQEIQQRDRATNRLDQFQARDLCVGGGEKKFWAVVDHDEHPLHLTLGRQLSILLQLHCWLDRQEASPFKSQWLLASNPLFKSSAMTSGSLRSDKMHHNCRMKSLWRSGLGPHIKVAWIWFEKVRSVQFRLSHLGKKVDFGPLIAFRVNKVLYLTWPGLSLL